MKPKTPYIVGMGPGDPSYRYPLVQQVIAQADVLIGGARLLEEYKALQKRMIPITGSLSPIVDYIAAHWKQESIVVLASGDTSLFSIRAYLQKTLPEVPFCVLPGISSLQYLLARRNVNLNEVKIITLHGSNAVNLRDTVARNRAVAIFTGGENSPQAIAARLCTMPFADLTVTVGEKLSYPDERVVTASPAQIAQMEFESLSLMLVENADPAARPWPYAASGLPDEVFLRGKAPMTKSEIRAVIAAKLRLREDSQVVDIGAGTGSVTVEAALTASQGHVWALEREAEAAALCRQNAERFALDNVTVIEGSAPESLPALPQVDRVFIGGSGGRMEEIIARFAAQPVRMVISAITVESVSEALTALEKYGFQELEIVQIAAARSKKAGSKHLMMGLNPITILSGERT